VKGWKGRVGEAPMTPVGIGGILIISYQTAGNSDWSLAISLAGGEGNKRVCFTKLEDSERPRVLKKVVGKHCQRKENMTGKRKGNGGVKGNTSHVQNKKQR